MPKVNPHSNDARYCVSISIYYKTLVEAEGHFERSKDLPNTTADLYIKDVATGEWDDPIDSTGYVEE